MDRSRPSLIMSRMYSVSPSQRDFKKAGSKLLPKSRFPGNFKLSPAIYKKLNCNSIWNEKYKEMKGEISSLFLKDGVEPAKFGVAPVNVPRASCILHFDVIYLSKHFINTK